MAIGGEGAVIIADLGGDRRAPLRTGSRTLFGSASPTWMTRSLALCTMAPPSLERPSTVSTGSGTAPWWTSPFTAGNRPRLSKTSHPRSSAVRPSARGRLTSRRRTADPSRDDSALHRRRGAPKDARRGVREQRPVVATDRVWERRVPERQKAFERVVSGRAI